MPPAAIMIGALVLVGLNLRASLMAVAPLLPAIQSDLRISAAHTGLVIALPVLLVGVAPVVCAALVRSTSACRVIAWSMVGVCFGVVIRSLGSAGSLGLVGFALGTLLLGTCIGMANAMLPAVVKQMHPPLQAGAAGLLNVTLCLGAALAAVVSPLVAGVLGNRWEPALAVWALPAVACAAVWWRLRIDLFAPPQKVGQADGPGSEVGSWLVLSPLAIALGLNMAAQSFLSQATTTWLPTLLISNGLGRQEAGAFLATLMAAQLLTALAGPWIANHFKNRQAVMASMYLIALTGFAACIHLPAPWNLHGAILLGLGQGGTFSIALHLVVLRAKSTAHARSLAFSTQLLGYTISASGPFVFGLLRDTTEGWNFALPAFTFVTLLGLRAGHAAAATSLSPILIDKD